LTLNAAVVLTTHDLEGAAVTPLLIPRVGHQPVILAIFRTPTQHLDGMAAKLLSGSVTVHSRLVSEEVIVDSEAAVAEPYCMMSFWMFATPLIE
jgi:hypothetical protein